MSFTKIVAMTVLLYLET